MTPSELSKSLAKIHEGNLESVILYGSAVGFDFSKKFSDYNIIVVLKDCSPVELAKSQKIIRKWLRKGNPPPLFFDPEHVKTSLDVFPLEFIDIGNRHTVLLGDDPFSQITVDLKNLRHQCEFELKGKILHLRSFYSAEGNSPKQVAKIMIASFPTFVAVFRGILTLLEIKPPLEHRPLIEELAKHIDFNPAVFMDIINIREGNNAAPRYSAATEAFENYLAELKTITNFVDQFQSTS